MSEPAPSTAPPSRRPLVVLALGAGLGLGLAAWALLRTDARLAGLPDSAVARVNGTWITADEYGRLVAGLESDTREAASDEARRRVLDRLIEEELLVQRGLEMGLAQNDRRVRADIAQAMIRSVVVEVEDAEPSREELLAFYAEEQGFFTRPGRMHVRQVFVRAPRGRAEEAEKRAREAFDRLEGGLSLAEVRRELGDEPVSPLPDTRLPAAKIREYLGPTALRTALELDVGERAEPFRSGMGFHVLELVDRDPPQVPPFDEVASLVEQEWRRRAGDRALREYLDALRSRADVEVKDELP